MISNTGTDGVTGALVNDLVPSALTGVTYVATGTAGATNFSTAGYGAVNDSVNLPAGASITYTISGLINPSATGTMVQTIHAATPPTVQNNAATSPDNRTNVSSTTVTLTPKADLYVSMNGSNPLAVLGVDTYTIDVTNAGPSDVTGATLSDTLTSLTGVSFSSSTIYKPTGASAVSISTPSGTLAGTSPVLSETMNIPVGGEIQFVITGTVASGTTAPSILTDTVSVADPAGTTDPVSANNSATVNASIVAGSTNTVVSEGIFYGNSNFDGSATAAGASPDVAVATDKLALLPGQANTNGQTANFNNYSNYMGGLNGVQIGVNGLTGTQEAAITASDFSFHEGNNNSPDSWNLAPTPQVTVYHESGSPDIIQFNWLTTTTTASFTQPAVNSTVTVTVASAAGLANGEVLQIGTGGGTGGAYTITNVSGNTLTLKNTGASYASPVGTTIPASSTVTTAVFGEWLQVTVKGADQSDTNTGLQVSDVFYFGSAPGDSGNSTTDARVNATDEVAARNDPHNFMNPASIADPHDYDRNKDVNSLDEVEARAYPTNFLNALSLITPKSSNSFLAVSSPAAPSLTTQSLAKPAIVAAAAPAPAAAPAAKPAVTTVLKLPVVKAGNYNLLPNKANQKIQIFVSGGEAVQGMNFEVQIADGGPQAGGTRLGPKITHVDILTGTIFAKNNTGQYGGSIVPQVYEANTVTAKGATLALGLIATITVDTTGFNGGVFPLLLTGTLNGNTDFTVLPAVVTNGTITIIPPPPPKGSISGTVFSDKNGDGKQQKGEAGLAGWVVEAMELVDGKEKVVGAAVTDKEGNFDVTNLAAGTYDIVVVEHPKQFKPTGAAAKGYQVKLGAGQSAGGYTFGEKPIA